MFRRSNNNPTIKKKPVVVPEETITYQAPQNDKDSLPPLYGKGPSGTLHIVQTPDVACPGHDKDPTAAGTIQLSYTIPNGLQASFHPHPGVAYDGVKRRAYLPATADGVGALDRLVRAFTRGHCFVVGFSETFQKDHQVTWNSAVPHKTNLTSGGPFGYPDDTYLIHLHQALDALRIPTLDQIAQENGRRIALQSFPQPYYIPACPSLGGWTVVPDAWVQLTTKEKAKCDNAVVDPNNLDPTIAKVPETTRLRELKVNILAAQRGVYLYFREWMGDEEKSTGGLSVLTEAVNQDTSDALAQLSSWKTSRHVRMALMTQGALQLKASSGLLLQSNIRDRTGTQQMDWTHLRAVHLLRDGLVVLVYQGAKEGDVATNNNDVVQYRVALYQTTNASDFLSPIVARVTATFAGTPTWAWPIRWSGQGWPALTPISAQDYKENWLGSDGGLASALFASLVAYHMRHKVRLGESLQRHGHKAIVTWIHAQQNESPHPFASIMANRSTRKSHGIGISPYLIDLSKLVEKIQSQSAKGVHLPLILQGLFALSFNLVFRKFKLCRLETAPQASFALREALARLCLYNVSLREMDFSGTSLKGMGEAMGKGWAMNAQPLISRLYLDQCELTDRDMRGLLPGLARIWCGQTALPEVLVFSSNKEITTTTWDMVFNTLTDPSSVNFWPSKTPPPPPNLAFLQELRLMGTKAVGLGLIRLVTELKGLRKFTFSANGSSTQHVLHALTMAGAPIELLHAEDLSEDCCSALINLGKTLRTLTLTNFYGDAGHLLCGWRERVPQLSVKFEGKLHGATAMSRPENEMGFCPGSLSVDDGKFGLKIVRSLATQVTGLKHLELNHMDYEELYEAAPILAVGGLETLRVFPPKSVTPLRQFEKCRVFWESLAPSKTLRELILPNQISDVSEITMIGLFLKTNRSVQKIQFDSTQGTLDLDSVATLRSAFYGNKKIQELQYPSKCRVTYMNYVQRETNRMLMEIQSAKASIKSLFKSHYSKYNRNWRDRPNQLKAPYVDRIRVAKRQIGKLERDSKKIAQHLDAIQTATEANRRSFARSKAEKDVIVQSRRHDQFQNLAAKKQKVLMKLIATLHKAKKRGRSGRATKTQVSRTTYYKSAHAWPMKGSKPDRVHSHYHYYNDPFNARFHFYYGYYSGRYNHDRDVYLDCISPNPETEVPPEPQTEGAETEGGEESDPDEATDEGFDKPILHPSVEGAVRDVQENSTEPADPWANIDDMIFQSSTELYDIVASPVHLAAIHEEAAELGVDVVADISSCLDNGAAVAAKLDDIAESTSIDRSAVEQSVDNNLHAWEEVDDFRSSLGTVEDYTDPLDADDAVNMYAGAGPRDLDDGGPSMEVVPTPHYPALDAELAHAR